MASCLSSWKNVSLSPLPQNPLSCLSFCDWVFGVLYRFWILNSFPNFFPFYYLFTLEYLLRNKFLILMFSNYFLLLPLWFLVSYIKDKNNKSCLLLKCLIVLTLLLKARPHYTSQPSPELEIFLPPSPEFWEHKQAPHHWKRKQNSKQSTMSVAQNLGGWGKRISWVWGQLLFQNKQKSSNNNKTGLHLSNTMDWNSSHL